MRRKETSPLLEGTLIFDSVNLRNLIRVGDGFFKHIGQVNRDNGQFPVLQILRHWRSDVGKLLDKSGMMQFASAVIRERTLEMFAALIECVFVDQLRMNT